MRVRFFRALVLVGAVAAAPLLGQSISEDEYRWGSTALMSAACECDSGANKFGAGSCGCQGFQREGRRRIKEIRLHAFRQRTASHHFFVRR